MTYHKFLYNFIINSCIILISDMYISFYTITVNRTIELRVALLWNIWYEFYFRVPWGSILVFIYWLNDLYGDMLTREKHPCLCNKIKQAIALVKSLNCTFAFTRSTNSGKFQPSDEFVAVTFRTAQCDIYNVADVEKKGLEFPIGLFLILREKSLASVLQRRWCGAFLLANHELIKNRPW